MNSTAPPDEPGARGQPVAVTGRPTDSIADWPAIVADLNRLVRLKTTPIGMKLFESVAEMEAVPDDELLMAPPHHLPKVIAGLEALSANGLRYPIPSYGIQSDARAGLGASYG